ncbi:MAG: hypothetical protein NVS1B13_23030 [Flavisolibacter sp.]
MADQYFETGNYYTAAGLYGQFLQSAAGSKNSSAFPLNVRHNSQGEIGKYKNKTDIAFKQAESFRLANYWAEAFTLYKECFKKDSATYPIALYWCAVCQRSLGAYSSAEENLKHFLINYSRTDEWYNAAIKEKQTLEFVKTQLSKPDSGLYHIQKAKTEFGDKGVFAPFAINKNDFLITSTQTDRISTGINPYHNRLFSVMLTNNDLKNIAPVIIDSIDLLLNQGAASISPDNNHLYLTQWKNENGQITSMIYFSNKTTKGWSKPQLLHTANQPGHNSKQPFCSADGKYLFFASDRTGGKGAFDIWYAPLLNDGTTAEAVNLSAINTPMNEQAPFYHNTTQTLVFASDRMPGMGGYDLFFSKGSLTEWTIPENMGFPINSSRDDMYFFANEKGSLLNNAIISSDRGSECCLATYIVNKTLKQKTITGLVMDCSANKPLDSAQVTLKDTAGKTWQTITGADGKYIFAFSDESIKYQLMASKEKYFSKSGDVTLDNSNGTNRPADTLHNSILCLEKKIVLKAENVVTLYFDFDKSELKDRGSDQLDSIYNIMLENPTFRLQISGYTDGKGSVEYNKKLSDRRARKCADYLIHKGLATTRISIQSFGALYPVEMELINGRDNANGRSKNRRALINIDKE